MFQIVIWRAADAYMPMPAAIFILKRYVFADALMRDMLMRHCQRGYAVTQMLRACQRVAAARAARALARSRLLYDAWRDYYYCAAAGAERQRSGGERAVRAARERRAYARYIIIIIRAHAQQMVYC